MLEDIKIKESSKPLERAVAKVSDFIIPEGVIHPLINPDSRHYAMPGGDEAIGLMEQFFSIESLMAWARITVMKYRLRIGKKDDAAKEVKKIRTYEEYYTYLDSMHSLIKTEKDK